MSTFQLGRAYPLPEQRPLKTKRDALGKRYKFQGAHFQFWPSGHVRVLGVDKEGVWCRREFPATKLPKWLRRGIDNHGKVQTKA